MGTWQGLVEVNWGRLTDEIYKRISNNHLMFSGMVVEELRGSFRVQFMHFVEDQVNKEFKTVKKVARQWDMKRVESFCCYEGEEGIRGLRKALSSLNFSLGCRTTWGRMVLIKSC